MEENENGLLVFKILKVRMKTCYCNGSGLWMITG